MMNVIDEFVMVGDETTATAPPGYERLFPNAPVYNPPKDLVDKLGKSMLDPLNKLSESKIPAGYTYFGQFVDHDITRAQIPRDVDPVDLPAVANLRSPFFDLKSLYGGDGAPPTCEIFASITDLKLNDTFPEKTGGVTDPFPNDLPRKSGSPDACLADERNDENLAIAQMHVAYIKFHNAVVRGIPGGETPSRLERAKEIVIRHYQWIVLHDYLPKILCKKVADEFLIKENQFYFPDKLNPKIPIEFSAAAFRLGHSMVRPFYQWNRIFRDPLWGGTKHAASINDLMSLTGPGGLKPGSISRLQLVSHWLIDWRRFFTFSGDAALPFEQMNFSAKIDTRISSGLGFLSVHNPQPPPLKIPMSLPVKNLDTGRRLRLPKGQDVAAAMKISPLEETELARLLPEDLKSVFAAETPLWFYILAESEIREKGERLGEVGSGIVAEVVKGLIEVSPISILRDGWRPTLPQSTPGEYRMTDLLEFIRKFQNNYDELNPVGN